MKTKLSLQNNRPLLRPRSVKTVVNRVLPVLMGCALFMQAQSQDKRLAMADQYFAAGEYYTAAGLYGQFLNPAVKTKTPTGFPLNSKRNAGGSAGKYGSKTDIMFRQAESYRLANYWKEAAELYKECFEKDATKYTAALYWYAVCQRSMGDYSGAEESINRFLSDYPGNSYQQAATKEKQTLQFIRTQLTRPDSVMYHVQKINTAFGNEKGVFAPAATTTGQWMVTSTQTDSVAAGMNPYHNRLFHSALTEEGLQHIEPVNIESVDRSMNQGAASISANGDYLYFTQWTKENGEVKSQIYYSVKTANGWAQPKLLASVNQSGHNSKQPFCSADGKYLFFASDRTGGMGSFDIWYAPIHDDGTTGAAVNAGKVLNSSANEQAPFYHNNTNTLVFASDRMPGMGGYDLFTSKGWETEWKMPENMGYPINSSRDDVYFFSAGNGMLLNNALVSSDRGSECCLATYAVSKTAKKKILAGIVRDCKHDEFVADATIIMKDASGKTWQTTTGADGKYSFELTDDSQRQLFISKEKYNDKTADIVIADRDEANWQTDILYNTEICFEKKLVIKVENVVTVYFDFDKSKLKDRATAQLDSIYQVLSADTTATIQISGYTDGRGTVEYNKKLSDKRAKACADYLIQKGLNPAKISFESFGACCPVEMELINGRDNPDGRSLNRRALINISRAEE